MGEKLLLDPNDSFFEQETEKCVGVAGSCYCCNQQIHVPFEHISELPLAKINKENFYVFICDQCEEDIGVLLESGVKDISYDVLWAIQETLEEELYILDEKNGGVTSIERDSILINLYREFSKKINNKKTNKYIESISEEETDDRRIKKSSKKDN